MVSAATVEVEDVADSWPVGKESRAVLVPQVLSIGSQ
jgi:hypothetical protein